MNKKMLYVVFVQNGYLIAKREKSLDRYIHKKEGNSCGIYCPMAQQDQPI
jgi:hypothetical protein